MGFDDFVSGLLDSALGGNDSGNQPIVPTPTVTPVPGVGMPAAQQQLPPEIIAALSGPFQPSLTGQLNPPKPKPPKKKQQQYQIPPGSFAGPEIPSTMDEVEAAVLPQYMLTSEMLPQELTHYQFGEGEEKRYIYLPDTKVWQPVPKDFFMEMMATGVVDEQGVPNKVPQLPDLEAPTDEDIAQWREALPEDMLGEIKLDAEHDVELFETQLNNLYDNQGRTFDKEGNLIDEATISNQIQELETKLDQAKSEVSEYEALQYILYNIEPPKSKKDWIMSEIVSPILGGVSKFFAVSDLARSQLGRRIGGYLAAQIANPVTGAAWRTFALNNGFGQILINPIVYAVSQTDQDVGKIYEEEGSIAVWEKVIAGLPDEQNWPAPVGFAWNAFTDTLYDPLTYVPIGGVAAQTMRGSTAMPGIARGIAKVAEPTLRYTDIVTSLPGTLIYRGGSKTARAVKTAINNSPYWKTGKAFAPSRAGEGKLLREAMGASAHKLELAADEYSGYQIGMPGGPTGDGGMSPFPYTPGTPPPNLTQDALTLPTPPRVVDDPSGPTVIGGPPSGPGPAPRPPGSAPRPTMLERAVRLLETDESLTPQQLSRKLKIKVADAQQLLPEARTALDTIRGPVQLYPSKVPGLQPHDNNSRIIDRGYQSYLRGEEEGRKFIEELNPVLQQYEADPVYNSRLREATQDAEEHGRYAWTQKARAMSFVADVAEIYGKYFDNLNTTDVNFLQARPRGKSFGSNDAGGLKGEYTEALMEEFALGDHNAKRLAQIEGILRNTIGHYVEVEGANGRKFNRAVGGLKSSDTGELPSYAADVIDELKAARKKFEGALSASRKAPKAPKTEDLDPATVIATSDANLDPDIERELTVQLDNVDDERTPSEVLDSIQDDTLDEPVAYPGNPSGGFNDVETVVIVEDLPSTAKESVELVETPDGTAAIIHKNKPSRATQERRKKAAAEVRKQMSGGEPSGLDDDVVERLAQQTAERLRGAATPVETVQVDLDPVRVEQDVIRKELTNDPDIPENAQVMTAKELADWRAQNVTTTVITGPRGEILETINRQNDDYLPSEGEFVDDMTGRRVETEASASTTPRAAAPREHVQTPTDPASLFPSQQDLYRIGSEQAWRDAGLNTPDAKGNPTSYHNFRSNVVPRRGVDLTNMDNKHVRYFRQYLARANSLPKEALINKGNAFAPGYEIYEEATRNFWDTMVRYARAMRTTGMGTEDLGIEELGFFKRAPGKVTQRAAKPELTDTQKANLDLFGRIFDVEQYRFDVSQIEMPEIGIDGRPIETGVDMLSVPGTNALRGAGVHWDFTPRGVFDKDIAYSVETTQRFDPDTLGSESLQDMSLALDVEDIDNAGKLIVERDFYNPVTGEAEVTTLGYASSLDEARLMVLKDLKMMEVGVKQKGRSEKFNVSNPGIVGPGFQQMQDIRDMLSEVGYAANRGNKQVDLENMPTYKPSQFRKDVMNYGGQVGHLNSSEVKLWDKRLDLDLASEDFMDRAEKKILSELQEGRAIDPSKIAGLNQQQREHLIHVFGIAAGLKNPMTYPKRVVLTDKVMIDVLSRVDKNKLGVKSLAMYERLGQTAAQRSKLGNIYLTARNAGLNEREAEDFVLKVAGFYTGPPGVLQNWDTAVRHAYMYNVVKAPFNLMQDTLNDALVGVFDGDASAVPRWAKLFVEQVKSNTAGSNAPIVKRYTNADTPILDEIQAFNKALGETIYPSVQSQRGGRYDDVAGRYVEGGKSWWESKGDSFGEWMDKTAFRGRTGTKSQTLFRNLGQIPAPSTVLRLRNSMDDMKRLGVDHTYAVKHYGEQVDKFLMEDLNRVARKVGKQKGITMEGQTLLDTLMAGSPNTFYGMPIFSPADVRKSLTPLVGSGQAEHLARKWSSHVGALKKAAADQTDKMLYSYTPSNLDEQISRLWMFHYWATRASSTHARLALENPFIMAAYYRAFEGTKRAAEEHGDVVPGWAKLFLPLQAGPFGMLGLVSPAALLSGLSVVLDLQGVAPNDFSWVDALQILPMRPVMAAAMAMSFDDRLPDPSGTAQTRRFVQSALNFFRNTGIAPVDEGLTQDYVNNAVYRLQALSHRGLAPLPGIDPLATPSPMEKDTQDVKFYAIQIMQDQGIWLDPATGQLTDDAAAVLANIDSGIYSGAIENEALRQFSIDSMYGAIGKSFLFSSIYPSAEGKIRGLARTAREAQNADLVPNLAVPPGGAGDTPEFYDVTPEITPEQEAAQLALRLADSGGPEATELIATMSQFKKIGDEEIRETWESMNDAIYEPGSVIAAKWGGDGIAIGENRFFTWAEWDRMGVPERREWMDLWVQTIGQEGELDQYQQDRDAFAVAHPVIQGYLDWQSAVNTVGPKAFLDRVLRDSEGFKAWWSGKKVSKKDIRSVLMTESAYLAAQGDKPSLYDPVGVETSGSPNLSSVMPQVGSESPSLNESWASMDPVEKVGHLGEQERVYMVRIQQFNDKVMSLTGGVPYGSLAPVSKRDIDIQLERMGLSAPEPGGQYAKYIQWAQAQPMGQDVSIESYVNSGASDR